MWDFADPPITLWVVFFRSVAHTIFAVVRLLLFYCRKKQEEAAIYQSVKEAKKAFEKMQKERKLREQEEKKQITKIKVTA